MKKIMALLVLGLVPFMALASGGHGVHLKHVDIDLSDQASMQRGARLFVNYCLSCHSAAYQRYSRMGQDLGLSDDLVRENLMFAQDKIGQTMEAAMRPEDTETFFGTQVPDLSLVARSRGPDWLYSYLLSFYRDDSRPWGVNNTVFPDVGMPHVLWELQGLQAPVYEEEVDHQGKTRKKIVGFELASEGQLNEKEYHKAVRDLVNFMTYLGEPAKLVRHKVGFWVLMFLIVFFVVAYALKKEYWKDVH